MIDIDFSLDARWPHSPRAGEPEVADIHMVVGRHVLTALADLRTGQNREFIRASAVSLAFWFADNWWRLRWETLGDSRPGPEWRQRHELSGAAGGTVWPPLMIYGTGARVVVSAAFSAARLSSGPYRFLNLDPVHLVSGEAYEAGLDAFFRNVIGACAQAQDGDALAQVLAELRSERDDPEVSAWRRLEASLGFDPDTAPQALMARMVQWEECFGEAVIEEAAAAAPGLDAEAALESAVEAARASPLTVDLRIAEAVDVALLQDDRRPWQLAEDAADQVRDAINMRDGPIRNTALGDVVQTRWEDIHNAPRHRLRYAARLGTRDGRDTLALQSRADVDRRFELGRMLGDRVWRRADQLGVISSARGDRQRFQRAFAQSLLSPYREVRRHVDLDRPTDAQIEDAARVFHVRPKIIKTLLVNKGVLPQETLAERLEAV